jgi:hypothetical protein
LPGDIPSFVKEKKRVIPNLECFVDEEIDKRGTLSFTLALIAVATTTVLSGSQPHH